MDTASPLSLASFLRTGPRMWRAGASPRRRLGLALLAGLLAACTDGYPPAQREPVEPQLMDIPQLIKALNTMGRRAADGATWSYRMAPACQLVVTTKGATSPVVATAHALKAARFELGYDKALPAYEVRATHIGGSEASASDRQPVLKAADWADAVFARSVLWHLQQDCD